MPLPRISRRPSVAATPHWIIQACFPVLLAMVFGGVQVAALWFDGFFLRTNETIAAPHYSLLQCHAATAAGGHGRISATGRRSLTFGESHIRTKGSRITAFGALLMRNLRRTSYASAPCRLARKCINGYRA